MTNKLIQQGAEAKIFLNEKENLVIKDRISKSYRIKEIDDKIRKSRTKSEEKILQKASKIINSPLPVKSTEPNKISMPYINGKKLSEHLNEFPLEKQKKIMNLIGESIAKLHNSDIIHGDLTTSNIILVEDDYNINKKNEDILINSKQISQHKVSANNLEVGREGGNSSNLTPKLFFIDFGLGFISKKQRIWQWIYIY
jgi:tRNA A-37 threonylcarbamoyl transferase component Bud32